MGWARGGGGVGGRVRCGGVGGRGGGAVVGWGEEVRGRGAERVEWGAAGEGGGGGGRERAGGGWVAGWGR